MKLKEFLENKEINILTEAATAQAILTSGLKPDSAYTKFLVESVMEKKIYPIKIGYVKRITPNSTESRTISQNVRLRLRRVGFLALDPVPDVMGAYYTGTKDVEPEKNTTYSKEFLEEVKIEVKEFILKVAEKIVNIEEASSQKPFPSRYTLEDYKKTFNLVLPETASRFIGEIETAGN